MPGRRQAWTQPAYRERCLPHPLPTQNAPSMCVGCGQLHSSPQGSTCYPLPRPLHCRQQSCRGCLSAASLDDERLATFRNGRATVQDAGNTFCTNGNVLHFVIDLAPALACQCRSKVRASLSRRLVCDKVVASFPDRT